MSRPVDLEEHARRRSAVRAGREAGESTRAIADRLGLGHSALYSWIRDYAPDLMSSLHTRSQLDEDECERRRNALDRAYYAGGMVADAAGELGLVTASLRSWMRRQMPTHPLATSDKRRTSAVPSDPPPPMLRSEAILGAQSWRVTSYAVADSWRVDCHVCLRRFTRESKTRADRVADAHARMHHLPPTVTERGLTIWGHRQLVAA